MLDAMWVTHPVQLHGDAHTGLDDDSVRAAAGHGISGTGAQLPYLDAIQRSFGDHDLSGVRAHFGQAASEANATLGSHAYATGNDVSFATSSPSMHLVAHEAAHVIQQRAGVHLSSAVGAAGDRYEQHADAVADAVVRGESAAEMLGADAGVPVTQRDAVQLKGNGSKKGKQPGTPVGAKPGKQKAKPIQEEINDVADIIQTGAKVVDETTKVIGDSAANTVENIGDSADRISTYLQNEGMVTATGSKVRYARNESAIKALSKVAKTEAEVNAHSTLYSAPHAVPLMMSNTFAGFEYSQTKVGQIDNRLRWRVYKGQVVWATVEEIGFYANPDSVNIHVERGGMVLVSGVARCELFIRVELKDGEEFNEGLLVYELHTDGTGDVSVPGK